MRKIITIDQEKCTGCGVCELICSALKEKTFNKKLSRVRVVNLGDKIDFALTCRFCENPRCVKFCPRKALTQGKNGQIIVDEKKCSGCGWCIEACNFGSITMHPKKRVVFMCDQCDFNPECVNLCPTHALQFINVDSVAGKKRLSAVKTALVMSENAKN